MGSSGLPVPRGWDIGQSRAVSYRCTPAGRTAAHRVLTRANSTTSLSVQIDGFCFAPTTAPLPLVLVLAHCRGLPEPLAWLLAHCRRLLPRQAKQCFCSVFAAEQCSSAFCVFRSGSESRSSWESQVLFSWRKEYLVSH